MELCLYIICNVRTNQSRTCAYESQTIAICVLQATMPFATMTGLDSTIYICIDSSENMEDVINCTCDVNNTCDVTSKLEEGRIKRHGNMNAKVARRHAY